MGAHKLDIEFEDEDEDDAKAKEDAAKKAAEVKKHAESMTELEFEASDDTGETELPAEAAAPAAPAQAAPAQAPVQQAAPAAAAPVQTGQYMHASPGAANYNLGDELRVAIGGNRILEIELQAKVEIAVTHRLTTIIAETAQENKVLETKVNKILSQVAAKAPALKKELAMIKKLLAEHSAVDKEKHKSEEASEKASSSAAPAKKKRPEGAPVKKKAA